MSTQPAIVNRYRWYELIGIYAGILAFLTFILAPFVEGFLVSLKPLSQLFFIAISVRFRKIVPSRPTGRCG